MRKARFKKVVNRSLPEFVSALRLRLWLCYVWPLFTHKAAKTLPGILEGKHWCIVTRCSGMGGASGHQCPAVNQAWVLVSEIC